MAPRVSVILPTYNRAHVLLRAVQSIVGQTYQDFELLIIDDGSTDTTADVVREINDSRVTYIRKAVNTGRSAARNTGLKIASGEYIAFQDSDDESHPTRLEKEVDVLDSAGQNIGIVYTDMQRKCRGGETYVIKSPHFNSDSKLYPDSLGFTLKDIGIGTCMMRTSAIKEGGPFDECLDCLEDLEYFIRLSKYCNFTHIQKPLLTYYEEEPDEIKVSKTAEARKIILAKYYNEIKQNRKLLAYHLFNIGNDLCYSGNVREGTSFFVNAIRKHPEKALYWMGYILSLCGAGVYKGLVNSKNNIMRRFY